MTTQIKDFFRNEEGAETLEYVVIVAIIVVLGATAYGLGLPDVIANAFVAIGDAITPPVGT